MIMSLQYGISMLTVNNRNTKGSFTGGNFTGGNFQRGNCPGGNYSTVVVKGVIVLSGVS